MEYKEYKGSAHRGNVVHSALAAIVCAVIAMVFVTACGTASKVGTAAAKITTPTAAEADSLVAAKYLSDAPGTEFRTFVLGEDENSKIFAFIPSKDSASVALVSLVPLQGEWEVESIVTYPDGDENGYVFTGFADTARVVESAGVQFFAYSAVREKGSMVQKSVNVYRPDQDSFQQLYFTGKRIEGGKIEGSSNEALAQGLEKPEMRWAAAKLHADEELLFLSEADIMTDQAIEWWLEKNPKALSGPSRITFGQIDEASSLVASYQKASKENLDGYRAATFNIRGYTVVVSYKKSGGTYSLVWAEPVCKNKNTDRYLNSIYQASGNTLSMFYYKGKTTFKYNLNLANGSLQKR